MIKQSNKLLSGMGNCNIVVLTLCQFFAKISGEGRFPFADILRGV